MKSAPYPPNETKRLEALYDLHILDTLPDEIFQELTDLAAEVCEVPMAAVSLVDDHRQWFKSQVGLEVPETDRDISFCGHAILQKELMEVEDTRKDERFADNPLVNGGPTIQFYAGVPLVTDTGMNVGTLCVMDKSPRHLSEMQRKVLRVLGRQVSRLLQQRLMEKRLGSLKSELQAMTDEALTSHDMVIQLNHIQETFIMHPSDQDAFEMLLELILRSTESEYGFVAEVLHDEEGVPYIKTHALTNIAWDDDTRKFYEENAPEGLEFRNLDTLFGHILTDQKPVIANHPDQDPRRGGVPKGHPALNAFLGLPVMLGEKLVGAIGIANRPSGYDQEIVDYLSPLLTTYGNLIQARRERTRREQTEEQLRNNENTLQQVLSATALGYWDWNVETGETVFSDQWMRMLGYEPTELSQTVDTWKSLIHPDDQDRVFEKLEDHLSGRSPTYSLEHRLRHKNGEWRWILTEGGIVMRDEEGRPTRVSGIHKDINDLKTIQAQEKELQDSRTMIQEIHHRIKNNLQIVSSMLAFQQRKTDDPDIISDFMVTRNRVATIALLHESLYRASKIDQVSLHDLCDRIVLQIREAFGVDPARIRFELDVEEEHLDYVRAGPCALILNEVITNAIKHAFPDNRKGTIQIRGWLDRAQERIRLRISDDGVGVKEPVLPVTGTSSIGMKLVSRLTDQLDGVFEKIPTDKGTAWELSIRRSA